MSVISAVSASRDRQPGLNEARSPKLPYPALDSRQSAILFFTTLAGEGLEKGGLEKGTGRTGPFIFFLPMTAATTAFLGRSRLRIVDSRPSFVVV